MKKIKVLGSDCCSTCTNVKKDIEKYIQENNIEAEVEKITDIVEVMKYGVMSFPSIVVDEQVKCTGKAPTKNDLDEWLK